ncbi:DUF5819 family protein [Streptomyces sp. JJ38]|uniref:DUF5819 family protein n=1 Tax=Streptomyces sp. JJ38 TaxID=2738128 RepID=UPI001C580348|nr:DUF5819 family protein [Streptomyces sp. JJ38]MBW1596334.1 hypothetical protein [Streptomyces sp. JJ38]
MTHQHRKVQRAALLLGAALLGMHFLMAALSQAPLSPAKVKYYGVVDSYLGPYFAQNWKLFAPDPLSDDRGILARAKCADGTMTEYFDVTTPYVKEVHSTRFFPSRMSRVVTGTLQQLGESDEAVRRVRENAEKDESPTVPVLPYERAKQDESVIFLSRYSMDHMPVVCNGNPQKIQIRMYIHELPPWSQRNNASAEGKVKVKDFAWKEVTELR